MVRKRSDVRVDYREETKLPNLELCGKVDHGLANRELTGMFRRSNMENLVYAVERTAQRRRTKKSPST